ALDAFGNLDLLQAIERKKINLCSERGLRDVNRNGAQQVIALALEDGMFLDLDDDVQVSRRTAVEARLSFVGQFEMSARIDARGNGDFELAFRSNVAFAAALRAGPAHDLTTAAALRASAANLQEALLVDHFAATVAHGAGHQSVHLLGTAAMAAGAEVHARDLNFYTHSANGLFERHLQVIAQIFAALGTVS